MVEVTHDQTRVAQQQSEFERGANNGRSIISEALSPYIADYYFAKITDAAVFGLFAGKLLDYYIEAYDGRGNPRPRFSIVIEDDGQASASFSADSFPTARDWPT